MGKFVLCSNNKVLLKQVYYVFFL